MDILGYKFEKEQFDIADLIKLAGEIFEALLGLDGLRESCFSKDRMPVAGIKREEIYQFLKTKKEDILKSALRKAETLLAGLEEAVSNIIP